MLAAATKTRSREANTTLSFERGASGQNWISFLFDIHWLNTIFHHNNTFTTTTTTTTTATTTTTTTATATATATTTTNNNDNI